MSLPNGSLILALRLAILVSLVPAATPAQPAETVAPPCRPCAGIEVEDPRRLLESLIAEPGLEEESRLYVAWDVPLDGSARSTDAVDVAAAGAIPWLRLQFRTPAPLTGNLDRLESELENASTLALAAPERTHFQIVWLPGQPGSRPDDYAFLIKRATVAVSGARSGARVISHPLPADPDLLERLYDQEVAAYLDGVALAAGGELEASVETLRRLDPGKPVIVDGLPFPAVAVETLPMAARLASSQVALTLFDAREIAAPDIAPLKLLAREFQGDLSFDPYSTPTGELDAWSFVRGEDLGLRVIVRPRVATDEIRVVFSDRGLKRPQRVLQDTGESIDLYGAIRTERAMELTVSDPGPVLVLKMGRLTASEIEGISGLDEKITVLDERQMPVEEILRRLQAFEDAQSRRLDTYQAVNSTYLRFQLGTEGIEVSFEGAMFFRRGEGFDWAWERSRISGLRWKGKELPNMPIIEPSRAASPPLEISFTKEYRYRLRDTEVINDRDCWVVDFEPEPPAEGEHLFQGTVWIDRELYARVRTRAVQLGLKGEVISNEETLHYTPLNAAGQPAEWDVRNLWLPTRVVSRQIWSLFNIATAVEKETLLTEIRLNDPEFESLRQAFLDSNTTMLRDTSQGLRYLVRDKKTGERVVREKLRPGRLFMVGGVFVDDALDFPLPLVGIDYFSLDFKNTGAQVNAFFAGALLNADIADPDFFGSKFDAGAGIFAIAVPFTDTLFRDNVEVPAEDVKEHPAKLDLTLGRKIGQFFKVNLDYDLGYSKFSRADNTAEEFVLPSDHFNHRFRLRTRYSRGGYRLSASGDYNIRSDWEPWGIPEVQDFDPATSEYYRWRLALAKTYHFKKFRKLGFEAQYVDGRNLDRFSKYGFGFFSDITIHGFQSGKIRAEQAYSLRGSYGIGLGDIFRLQVIGDAAWATDEESGLRDELLAGVGVAGNFIGPWNLIVRIDGGVPVAGPDDGFTLFLTFLKLFR